MKSHSDEKSHKCSICGKFFKYKSSLNSHLAVHKDDSNGLKLLNPLTECHTEEGSLVSMKDGKAFHQNSNLSIDIGNHKRQGVSTSHCIEKQCAIESLSIFKSGLSPTPDHTGEDECPTKVDYSLNEAKLHTSEDPFVIDVKVEECF